MLTLRNSADDMWMTYVPADDVRMTYLPVDDVLDDIPTCGRHADDIWTTYVIHQPKSPTKSHSHVVRMSSTHRTHETSVPRLFQVKQQRTALLKMKHDDQFFSLMLNYKHFKVGSRTSSLEELSLGG